MLGLETAVGIVGLLDVASRIFLELYELAGKYHNTNELTALTIIVPSMCGRAAECYIKT